MGVLKELLAARAEVEVLADAALVPRSHNRMSIAPIALSPVVSDVLGASVGDVITLN